MIGYRLNGRKRDGIYSKCKDEECMGHQLADSQLLFRLPLA